jgi:uncharacterized protein (TIRG00374 family)
MIVRLAKIVVSITLISILLWGVDWSAVVDRLRVLDSRLAFASFIFLSVQYPLSAWKWRKSLRLHGADGRIGRLLRILCIGFFFNNFLPTTIGGDAYRAYRTFDYTKRPAHAISAVVFERLLGIFSLLFLGYLCAIYLVLFGSLLHRELILTAVLIVGIGFLAALLAWHLRSAFVTRIARRLSKLPKLEPLSHSLRTIKRNRQHLPGLIGLSLLFQATAIFTVSLMFASIGIHGTLAESGFTAAASGAAGILPISINGVGVMEGSFVVAALEAGLPYSEAVLVALCLRGYMLLSSVVFGLLYAFDPKDPAVLKEKGAN